MVEEMERLVSALRRHRQVGQGLVEYALILVLIAVVAIGVLTLLGSSITSVFSSAASSLSAP